MSLVKRILIANRGQIACRIMRTAKRLGVQTVAVYSDIDRDSKFVDMADRAYRVGPNPSIESYLNSSKILQIALQSQCEALHPGFGFLSQNASFSDQCNKAGVKFIGPPASAIISMGSKSESKKIMTKASVPVVPGYHQQNQQADYLAQQAQKIGYPVLIKAVSGGGGKGMRIVNQHKDFAQSLQSCKRQSLKAFKDDRVIIQRYITRPRHIEVQIFGDQQGNYVHLYERDCSIQRRHQKVVEEAPSNISDQIRNSVCQSAINAAKAVGYYNAGTVEFIFDLDSKQHFFMQMNTRLQVEHPISQMITGYDFVEWQLLVASGFPLPKKQSQINKKGNAIQVRIYSQDPFNNFLPGNGKLQYFKEPSESEGVRIQTGVRQKDTISTFYDPMIAKLITYGKDRDTAIELMKKALSSYRAVGLPNNLKFLKRVIDEQIFKKGDYDTSYIPQNIDLLLKKEKAGDPFSLACAVIARNHTLSSTSPLPAQLFNFRNAKTAKKIHNIHVKQTFLEKEEKFTISQQLTDKYSGKLLIDGKSYIFTYTQLSENQLHVIINNQVRKIQFYSHGNTIHLFDEHGDCTGYHFETDNLKQLAADDGAKRNAISPMPGTISKIFVKPGDKVKKGEAIFAMEAMKMQHVIRASTECVVKSITYKEGDFVESHKDIVHLE